MKVKYTSICSKVNLRSIRSFITEQLEDVKLTRREKSQIVLAVDEACANAIIHGNKCDETKEIQISVETDSDKIVIEIIDEGINEVPFGFVPEKDIKNLIKEKRKGGIGLKLINEIMDEIHFYKKNNRNVCILIKGIG